MKHKLVSNIFLAISFVFVFVTHVYAQETTPSLEVTANPTPTIVEEVEYTLPYPGMLPDNPLYNVKALRDRIIEFLISSPFKKAEFYLLSSDKRFNSGYYLIMKDKDDMGVLYISKSNNYMDMGITQAQKASDKGEALLKTMKTAIKKHTQLIKELTPKVDQENKSKLKYETDRLNKMQLRIK